MDNGGNQRDLTVNLRLVADASNAKTARSIAQEVQKAEREIQSAHGTTIEHLKKLDELVPRTNQQIARGLQEQAAGYRRLGTVQSIVQTQRASMIESGHELAGALGSAAHSMADLTSSSEEQARSSHEFIASMEGTANSVLEIATAASSAYTELKKLQALRSTASTASAGGGQLLSGAGGLGAGGAGGGVASLAALAAPAAAAAAALAGVAAAGLSAKEVLSGEAERGEGFTGQNIVQPIVEQTAQGFAIETALDTATFGIYDLIQNLNGTRLSQDNLKKSNDRLARTETVALDRKTQNDKQNAFFAADSFQRHHQTSRSIALLEHRRNRLTLTRGLDGTQHGLAANTFDLQDARQRASAAPVLAGSLAKTENFQDRIKAQRDIQRLLEQRVGLERRTHQEAVQAKQKELSLTQQQLAAQEQRRLDAGRQVDNVAGRLASLRGGDKRRFNAAVESTRDGEISFKEAQELRGIPVFEKLIRDATFKQARSNDTAGLLDRLIQAQEKESQKERKIALSVEAQNNVVVELQKNIDVDKVVDGLKEKIGDALNFEAELRQALTDYSASQALQQNVFNQ